MSEFGALGLVLIISLTSELEIMHRFFCWIPWSLRNYLKIFLEFLSIRLIGWEPPQPVRWILVKIIIGVGLNSEHPSFFFIISPSSELGIAHHFFFLDSLFFKKHSVKISIFFLSRLNQLASGSIDSSSQLV